VPTYDRIADLPIEIEGYALDGLERDVSSEFTRLSTVIRLRGGGHEGVGEDVTYERKMREMVLASRIERTLGKPEILELYLNVIEWGDGIFGAEAASRRYFGTSSAALTAEQAARPDLEPDLAAART